jgi:hypothetical protein
MNTIDKKRPQYAEVLWEHDERTGALNVPRDENYLPGERELIEAGVL